MGTRSNIDDTEKTMNTNYTTASLYRGLLDITRSKHDNLTHSLISLVRSYDKSGLPDRWDSENHGFWRMLLELILTVWVQIMMMASLLIIVCLVIMAWPIKFLVDLFQNTFRGMEPTNHLMDNVDPALEAQTIATDSDKTKIVRRVVYEETKAQNK